MKGWEEIADLGRKIVKTLNTHSSDDPLRVWMAHYIAELMKNEKAAKSKKQQDSIRKNCAELILRLWNIRYQFDTSHPINQLNHKLEVLVGDNPWPRPFVKAKEKGSPKEEKCNITKYERNLKQIDELSEQDKRVIFAALVADLPEEAPEEVNNSQDSTETNVNRLYKQLISSRNRLVRESEDKSLKEIVDAKSKLARKKAVTQALIKNSMQRRKIIKMLS